MSVFIVSFLVALCVSGLCSVAESVLLSLSTAQIAEIEQKNKKIASLWTGFKKDLNAPITSILAVNTAAHTIGASVAGAAFADVFGASWLWLFSIVFTFLMLQYTEILPKTLGVRYAKQLAFWVARPLAFATKFGAPIIATIRFFNRPFEPKTKDPDGMTPVKEIGLLTRLAARRRLLDEEQGDVILAALNLSKKTVRDVMSPFDEASTLSDVMSVAEALEIARVDAHTRFPVCRGLDRENIVGYVNLKDLILNEHVTNLGASIRPIPQVIATKKVSDVLDSFVENHEHIALVVDPTSGRYVGLVTLEDLVEELVGEIEDEFDKTPKMLYEKNEPQGKALVVGGGRPLADVRREVARLFPNESAAFLAETENLPSTTTLSQWFEKKSNGNVVRNSRVFCDDLEFLVRRARRGQVFDARVSVC